MKIISADDLDRLKVTELGLDLETVHLTSVEAVSGALRRAAGFLCPCSSSTLVSGVVSPLRGLVDDSKAFREMVKRVLEDMISHGDILECRDIEAEEPNEAALLLYVAPLGFVAQPSGTLIVLGIACGNSSSLPDSIRRRVTHRAHLRLLDPEPNENLRTCLREHGLIDISYDRWLKAPREETPTQHISRIDGCLDKEPPSRDVPGLSLIDPERPNRYYRGRWVQAHVQSGRFVARRKQAYGADLWCYAQLRDGRSKRLIDFPLGESRWRGCDEAWHLQMALDARRGEAQKFHVMMGSEGTKLVQFFSPLPAWARRRLDASGILSPSPAGCLFEYQLPAGALSGELEFICQRLWLEELKGNGS